MARSIVHPEGTDYVFLGSTPVSYDGEGVVFRGQAGAVRLDKTSVTLVKAGGEGKVGYKGHVLSGVAACDNNFILANLKPGEERIMSPMTKIALPTAAPAEKALAPGVMKSTLDNGVIRYRLAGTDYVHTTDGDVRLEGSAAMVEVSGTMVRFVAESDRYVQLSVGNRGIRGVGPFDLTFTATGITGTVDGATRSLVVTWPEDIIRPMFRMDGMRYYAGWPDDHSIGKGTVTPQFCIGFGVTDGPHMVNISEWTYPNLPVDPKQQQINLK